METLVQNDLRTEEAGTQGSEAVLVRVADVARRAVGWLWPGRVPSGKLTLVAGDPGLGKSLVALDIAARVTRGLPWPDSEEEVGSRQEAVGSQKEEDSRRQTTDGSEEGIGGEGRGDDGQEEQGGNPQGAMGRQEAGVGSQEMADAAGSTVGLSSLPTAFCRLPTDRETPSSPIAPATASYGGSPGNVILLSAEDDVADTIRPRLEAAGADLGRVAVLETVRRPGAAGTAEDAFSLAGDLDALERAIERTGDVRLIVIDPLTAYLGRAGGPGGSDPRALLTALKRLAQRRRVAILGIMHLNKNAGTSALYRATGRLAFVAAARAVWAVASDPGRPGRHLLLPVKCNLAGPAAGLAFTIQDSPEHPGAPVLAWEPGSVLVGADDALAATASVGREGPTARQQAAEWLRELLAPGPVAASQVMAQARLAGFCMPTLRRAKAILGVEVYREGYQAPWQWRLPVQR